MCRVDDVPDKQWDSGSLIAASGRILESLLLDKMETK